MRVVARRRSINSHHYCTRSELCQWQLIGCYHFVMFMTYNQLMWVFKVLFGYDCTPNKSVQPLFGSTNTDCTGLTDRQTDFSWKPPLCQFTVKGKTKKAVAFGLFVFPILQKGNSSEYKSTIFTITQRSSKHSFFFKIFGLFEAIFIVFNTIMQYHQYIIYP